MAAAYVIGGVRFHRRCLVKLLASERATLAAAGHAVLRRPVEWPLPGKEFDFGCAYRDPGGSLWGPGPYLKVPNRRPGDDWEAMTRVFCPWGYPPDRLRVAWSRVYLQLVAVELDCLEPGRWEWLLHVAPCQNAFGPSRRNDQSGPANARPGA
jgi:hypothetical protein